MDIAHSHSFKYFHIFNTFLFYELESWGVPVLHLHESLVYFSYRRISRWSVSRILYLKPKFLSLFTCLSTFLSIFPANV